MYLEKDTLDDIIYSVFECLIDKPFEVRATKGATSEEIGNLIVLKNPLARLSLSEDRGKPFSALGELMWYLSGSNNLDLIKHYLPKYCDLSETGPDGKEMIYGGYGSRLFKMHGKINQINQVLEILKKKPTSRQAVIQIFDASDLQEYHKDVPCTTTLQFFIRQEKLQLYVTMRSNDSYMGLPHDIFTFTMIQEIIARDLGIEIGYYYHSVSSLHLYERNKENANSYLDEGLQWTSSDKAAMPAMPSGSPWESVNEILRLEESIRNGTDIDIKDFALGEYWGDIGILLKIHAEFKNESIEGIYKAKGEISNKIYLPYISNKLACLVPKSIEE